jgi:hypothetical protein
MTLLVGIGLLPSRLPISSAAAAKIQKFNLIMGEGEVIGEVGGKDQIIGEFHRWEPPVLVAFKGDTVVINVSNPRRHTHTLVIPDYGISTKVLAPRGGSETVRFSASKTGTFQFVCGLPHDEATGACDPDHRRMTGYLIVLDR